NVNNRIDRANFVKMHAFRWHSVNFPFGGRDALKHGDRFGLNPFGQATVRDQTPDFGKRARVIMVVIGRVDWFGFVIVVMVMVMVMVVVVSMAVGVVVPVRVAGPAFGQRMLMRVALFPFIFWVDRLFHVLQFASPLILPLWLIVFMSVLAFTGN